MGRGIAIPRFEAAPVAAPPPPAAPSAPKIAAGIPTYDGPTTGDLTAQALDAYGRMSLPEAEAHLAQHRAQLASGGVDTGEIQRHFEAAETLRKQQDPLGFVAQHRQDFQHAGFDHDRTAGVQERSYQGSPEAQARIEEQVQKFDPGFLVTDNPDAVNAPPVITPGGLVVGGYSQAMTLQRVYAGGRDAAYLQAFEQAEPAFGVSRQAVAGMRQPVLVRELQQPPATVAGHAGGHPLPFGERRSGALAAGLAHQDRKAGALPGHLPAARADPPVARGGAGRTLEDAVQGALRRHPDGMPVVAVVENADAAEARRARIEEHGHSGRGWQTADRRTLRLARSAFWTCYRRAPGRRPGGTGSGRTAASGSPRAQRQAAHRRLCGSWPERTRGRRAGAAMATLGKGGLGR